MIGICRENLGNRVVIGSVLLIICLVNVGVWIELPNLAISEVSEEVDPRLNKRYVLQWGSKRGGAGSVG